MVEIHVPGSDRKGAPVEGAGHAHSVLHPRSLRSTPIGPLMRLVLPLAAADSLSIRPRWLRAADWGFGRRIPRPTGDRHRCTFRSCPVRPGCAQSGTSLLLAMCESRPRPTAAGSRNSARFVRYAGDDPQSRTSLGTRTSPRTSAVCRAPSPLASTTIIIECTAATLWVPRTPSMGRELDFDVSA